MPGPPAIVGVFDRAAATYDAVGVPFFGPVAEGLVAELAPGPGERVLDLGCGRGAVLAAAARLVGPSGRAVGVDLAPEMVRRTALDLEALAQVSVLVDDASAPSWPAASFDVVASSLVLPFLPEPSTALGRWTDLLVPGGRLGVTTFGEEAAAWAVLDACFVPFLPPEVREEPRPASPPDPEPWDSDDGMEALLADAGLTDVRTVRRTVTLRFADADQLVAFTWSHAQRARWEAVAPQDRAEVDAAVRVAASDLGLSGDGLVIHQPVRTTLGRRPV